MSSITKIACLSLLATPGPGSYRCKLPTGPIEWDVIPVPPDLELIRDKIRELLNEYDAVTLDGITSTFRIGKKRLRYEYLWNFLKLQELGDRFSDGSGLRATLERFLVRQAADLLKDEITGKRILFFSGLNRYGSAEVLSGFSRHLMFGDLLYGFRLGIPITSFAALVRSAPRLITTISQRPAQWYWPAARRSRRLMPRFQMFFRGADVIIGGLSYFQRYIPNRLDGKIIFTNLRRQEDIEMFASRGARYVVSMTPVIDREYVPLPVLEAALLRHSGTKTTGDIEDYFINQIHQMSLKPKIHDLAPELDEELAVVPKETDQQAELEPKTVEELALTEDGDTPKFAFVIHPLSFKYVMRLKSVRIASRFLPRRWIEDGVAHVKHFIVGGVKNVVSKTGARAEGIIYAVPMTSKAIMRFKPQFLYRKLIQIAKDADKLDCRIMGLGAYTSVVGDAGLSVSQGSPIGITSGNSYTVSATLKTLEAAAERCGINLDHCAALVVGATGSIGSVCARLLAKRVGELSLVSPRPEKLLGLSDQIRREAPELGGKIFLSRDAEDFLPKVDVIISTTSSVDPLIDVSRLKPGCVVCDVARPSDIKQAEAESRSDILVIEAGEIKLPEGAELTYDIGLPPQTIYACLAETLLLTLDRRFDHFTIGREIELEKVKLMGEISERHGFELADIRSFGMIVPDEHYERLLAINQGKAQKAGSAGM